MRCAYICLLLGVASTCHAQVILQPEGLEPGDQYRLIFTTSQKRDATSSNIEDYNNFVQSVAESSPEAAMWGLEWKAVAATMEVDARSNTGVIPGMSDEDIPVYRVDGVLMALSYDLFWRRDNSFNQVTPNINEFGELISDENGELLAWTGTSFDGTTFDPESTLGNTRVHIGLANSSSIDTWSWKSTFPELQLHMYAVSELIVAVPEPGYFDLQTLALAGIVFFRMGRSRDERRSRSAFCEQLLQPSCGTNTAGAV